MIRFAGDMQPFIANTDKAWFNFLSRRADHGRLDEVNFWSPRSTRPMKRFTAGEPVFFRLKRPDYAVAGYGFYAHFAPLGLREAWEFFGEKNGDPDEISFLLRIGKYRGLDLLDPRTPHDPLGCTVLRDARFWPPHMWIPWTEAQGWARNIVQGRSETDPERASMLLQRVTHDAHHEALHAELGPSFELLDADRRRVAETRSVLREGQGTFRARLLDAYHRRCAITGERTEPVLDAAHIQPYLGPRSNHIQNGILLTKEFHTLFDRGYVTITPSFEVRVSPRLADTWQNGRRYYTYDGQGLAELPDTAGEKPSQPALEWHNSEIYLS